MEAIEIKSELNTSIMGFDAYCALKHNFNFKLKVGDIVQLHIKIKGLTLSGNWNTGCYRVTSIGVGIGSHHSKDDARFWVYRFEKIKKDGTKSNNNYYSWNCQSFDHDLLEKGMATLLSK